MAIVQANSTNTYDVLANDTINKLTTTDTFATLQAISDLTSGDRIQTLGYYVVGDGGAQTFLISNLNVNGTGIQINPSLYAIPIFEGEINPIQYGARCNGSDDDAEAIRKCLKLIEYNDGGTLNFLDNKTYNLKSPMSNGGFFNLTRNIKIKGLSTLKIDDFIGDFYYIFSLELSKNIQSVKIRDITINENSSINRVTSETGQSEKERMGIRFNNYIYSVEDVLIENVSFLDVIGVWQVVSEGRIQNFTVNNNYVRYNENNVLTYDRTSFYLSAENTICNNNRLLGSTMANTAIEFHSKNMICENNIIEEYNSGFFICNDPSNPTPSRNGDLSCKNNYIKVRNAGIVPWLEMDNQITKSIVIESNEIIIFGNGSKVRPIGFHEVFGKASSCEVVAIKNNKVINENTFTDDVIMTSLVSVINDVNYTIDNLIIEGNTYLGDCQNLFHLATDADNSIKLKNLEINNNFYDVNCSGSFFWFISRLGIGNVNIYDNNIVDIKKNGSTSNLILIHGEKISNANFKVKNNKLNFDVLTSRIVSSEYDEVLVDLSQSNIIISDGDIPSYFDLSTFKAKDGSKIESDNYSFKKVDEKWIFEYKGNENPTKIAINEGSKIQTLENSETLVCFKTGFIPNKLASDGDNKVGDWVQYGLYVYQSLTDNNYTIPTDHPDDFKYIGENAELRNISAENVIKYYNIVDDMKRDADLKVGDVVKTLGYYEVGDGGGAEYVVVDNLNENDDGYLIELNPKISSMLLVKDKVKTKQFGSVGDGTSDDTVFIQNLFNYISQYKNKGINIEVNGIHFVNTLFLGGIKENRLENITISGLDGNRNYINENSLKYGFKIKTNINYDIVDGIKFEFIKGLKLQFLKICSDENVYNGEIPLNTVRGLNFKNCNGFELSSCNITGLFQGVYAYGSGLSYINNNNVSLCNCGIWLQESGDNTLTNNYINTIGWNIYDNEGNIKDEKYEVLKSKNLLFAIGIRLGAVGNTMVSGGKVEWCARGLIDDVCNGNIYTAINFDVINLAAIAITGKYTSNSTTISSNRFQSCSNIDLDGYSSAGIICLWKCNSVVISNNTFESGGKGYHSEFDNAEYYYPKYNIFRVTDSDNIIINSNAIYSNVQIINYFESSVLFCNNTSTSSNYNFNIKGQIYNLNNNFKNKIINVGDSFDYSRFGNFLVGDTLLKNSDETVKKCIGEGTIKNIDLSGVLLDYPLYSFPSDKTIIKLSQRPICNLLGSFINISGVSNYNKIVDLVLKDNIYYLQLKDAVEKEDVNVQITAHIPTFE